MNVLLVGDYPNDPRLGSAKVPHKLAEEFRRLGHRCDLLFADDFGPRPRGMHPRQFVGPLLAARAIARAVRRFADYDVIDVASGEGLAVPLLRRLGVIGPRTAFVSRSHGLEHRNYQRMVDDHHAGLIRKPWYKRLWYPLVRLNQVALAARLADRFIVLNPADRGFVVAKRWMPPDRVATVGHGVSEKFLASAPPPAPPSGGGILFCGTWTGVKGVDYLVPAFAKLTGDLPPRLTVLGGHVPAASILAAFPEAVRPRVTVLDRLSEDRVMAEYGRHDVLVFPSTFEGFGMVVPEAMSQRLPVVACPVGCASVLIRHGENGWLVPPRNPEALAATLQAALADESLRRRAGEAARATVDGMTWAATAARTLAVYADAITAQRRRGGACGSAS